MNNTAVEKSRSVLGIISLVSAILIGICFVILGAISLILQDINVVFVWVYPTFITAPIGIILGTIAFFKKRAWAGLALNTLFLIISIGLLIGTVLYNMMFKWYWR